MCILLLHLIFCLYFRIHHVVCSMKKTLFGLKCVRTLCTIQTMIVNCHVLWFDFKIMFYLMLLIIFASIKM